MSRKALLFWVVGVSSLGGFALQGWHFANLYSQTYDEGNHLVAGYSYWVTGDFRLNIEDPPLMKWLWAAPVYLIDRPDFSPDAEYWAEANSWRLAVDWLYGPNGRFQRWLVMARMVNVAVGACLIVLLATWVRSRGGDLIGCVTWVVAANDPNLLALSVILSSDMGLTFATLLLLRAVDLYCQRPTGAGVIAIGVAVGLVASMKFSCVMVFAALFVSWLAMVAAGGQFALPESLSQQSLPPWRDRLRAGWAMFVRTVTVALIVAAVPYLMFHFPDWGRGLKLQLVRQVYETPSFYLMGEISSRRFLLYYPVVLMLKMPVGLQVACVLACVMLVRHAVETDWKRDGWLALFGIAFFAIMVAVGVNLGVRVILPVYPLLILFGMQGIHRARRHLSGMTHGCLLFCVALLSFFTGVSTPSPLAYFNPWVDGDGWKWLGDSNLDWGQDLIALRQAMEREGVDVVYLSYAGTAPPERYGVRFQYLPGVGLLSLTRSERVPESQAKKWLAVSVTNLQGIYLAPDSDLYARLRSIRPTHRLLGAIWVYDVTDEPELVEWIQTLPHNP